MVKIDLCQTASSYFLIHTKTYRIGGFIFVGYLGLSLFYIIYLRYYKTYTTNDKMYAKTGRVFWCWFVFYSPKYRKAQLFKYHYLKKLLYFVYMQKNLYIFSYVSIWPKYPFFKEIIDYFETWYLPCSFLVLYRNE